MLYIILASTTQRWRDGLFSNDVVSAAVKTGIISATDGKSAYHLLQHETGNVGISSDLTVNGNLYSFHGSTNSG